MFALIDFESGLLTDKRLGIRELKVYIVLAGHADKKTRMCWPSRKRISDLTGIHPSNVSVATRKLEECGYLEKRINSGGANHYKLLEPLSNPIPVSKTLQVSKEQQSLIQIDTQPLLKTTTQNIQRTKKENTKQPCWSELSFRDFKNLKTRLDYTDEFLEVWKLYSKACSHNQSEEGSKLEAFFRFLQILESGVSHKELISAIEIYIQKKEKAQSKLAHLRTFLNQPEMIEQFLSEIKERDEKTRTAKFEGFENRFQSNPAS